MRLHVPRRALAAFVLLAQVALLVMALTLPAFRVHRVAVAGTALIDAESVLAAAAVPEQSVFTVDAEAIRTRVESLPWVQGVSVSTEFPGTVHITVEERAPAVRLRHMHQDLYVAANGATMAVDGRLLSVWKATPALLDERMGSQEPLDPALLRILQVAAQRFPAVYGCSVAAYVWGSDGVFSIWTSTGWTAVLGHVDTADAVAMIPAQLAALGALRGQLDFKQPGFGYVRLENPGGPAVAGVPGLPDDVTAAALPLPVAAPSSPVATGVPPPSLLRPLPHMVVVSQAGGSAFRVTW